jgi:hypothetical protein
LIFGVVGLAFGLGYHLGHLYQMIGMVVFAGAIELAQDSVAGRHARMSDFIVDATGACIGVIVGWLAHKTISPSWTSWSSRSTGCTSATTWCWSPPSRGSATAGTGSAIETAIVRDGLHDSFLSKHWSSINAANCLLPVLVNGEPLTLTDCPFVGSYQRAVVKAASFDISTVIVRIDGM